MGSGGVGDTGGTGGDPLGPTIYATRRQLGKGENNKIKEYKGTDKNYKTNPKRRLK